MRTLIILGLLFLGLYGCKQETENTFNINEEPLSTKAELKAATWIGYKDFSYELKDLSENFTKALAIEKRNSLLSAAQSVLYSMPNDLRNDIMNERAAELLELTKAFFQTIETKSEAEIADELKVLVGSFTKLNKDINYYTEN